MNFQIELTGNEARFLFFSIKNKKSDIAIRVRQKLIAASENKFSKQKDNAKTGNTN